MLEINRVKDTMSLVTKTPWLRHTKWEERFMGKDMDALNKLAATPDVKNYNERRIWDQVGKMLNKCWLGFHDVLERGWELVPFWLASAAREKEDTKPFRKYIAPYTLRRYISYWQSFMLFCIRGFQNKDYGLEFTEKQQNNLMTVLKVMDDITGSEELLYEALLSLAVSLICHSDYSRARSSLIYFTGVLGYNVDWKQWRPPQDYTTILAGFQFCMRVIMLEYALPTEERDTFMEDSEVTPIQQFCRIRNIWLIDGEGISCSQIR